MSQPSTRHPLRLVLLMGLVAGIVVVLRNAVADKGGSYDPAAPVGH